MRFTKRMQACQDRGDGYRTWRLALPFFGGLVVALLISNQLVIARNRTRGVETVPVLLLAWPVTHLLVMSFLAYAPLLLRGRKRSNRVTLAACAVLYAVAVSVSLASTGGWAARGPAEPGIRMREAAQQISSGVLVPDESGMVLLPADLGGCTVDGKAFVTIAGSGRPWTLFRTWRGKGANSRGYLYTSGDPLSAPAEVSVITDNAGVVARAEIIVEADLGNCWYRVSRTLD